jgi:hypothetical protein
MIRSTTTTPPIIQPTGVELVVDWVTIVVDLWVVTVVGVTTVVGASVVVVGSSVLDVVVTGSVVGVVVGASVVGTSVVSVGAVVVAGRTAPEPGVDPPAAVVGVDPTER